MLSSAASCMALQPHGNVVTRGTACPQDLGPQPPLQGPKKIKKKKMGTTAGNQRPVLGQTAFFLSATFSVFVL
jgi:hypothetical protein